MCYKYLSSVCGMLFHSFTESIGEQKFLILMWSNLSIFSCIVSILCVKKIFPTPKLERHFLYLSFKTFVFFFPYSFFNLPWNDFYAWCEVRVCGDHKNVSLIFPDLGRVIEGWHSESLVFVQGILPHELV